METKLPNQRSARSSRRRFLFVGALLSVILFDAGNSMRGLLHSDSAMQAGVQAASSDHTTLRLLKQAVPGADGFSKKSGEPPVYRAYHTDPDSGEKTLIGYAFVTPDVPPEPNGYSGPIDTLVGIDLKGKIVGLKVIYYKESLRYSIGDFFSWGFEEQFVGKRASDRFQVGKDIDGVVKATISSKAAARGIRQALRAVVEAYIH